MGVVRWNTTSTPRFSVLNGFESLEGLMVKYTKRLIDFKVTVPGNLWNLSSI